MAKNVRSIALKDIAEWMREQNIHIQDNHGDVWVVSAYRMNTSEQRKLNKELGVSNVNYSKRQ